MDIDQILERPLAKPTEATVHDIKSLSGDVWQVLLKPITDYPYQAGQYTELLVEGYQALYFTIGSGPKSPCVELHIQGGSATNDSLIQHLQAKGSVMLAPAQGDCTLAALPNSEAPLLLIASGTGFSQVKAMAEDLIQQGSNRPIYIYWASFKLSQLYMLDKAESWAEQWQNIHAAMLISEHSHWDDKHQMLVHSILSDHSDLQKCQAVTCGSPEMVYTVLDTLTDKGFIAANMISDVFAFAPRDGS